MTMYGSDSVGFFLVGGYELKGVITELEGPFISSATEDSNGLGTQWPVPLATGMRSAELKQNGFFDDATNSIHAAMKNQQDVQRVFAVALHGNVAGKLMDFGAGGMASKYTRVSGRGTLHKAVAEYRISGAIYQDGVILKALGSVAVDGDTQGAPIDNGIAAAAVAITSSSVANPSIILTAVPHLFETGDTVAIAGHAGSTPAINGNQIVTKIDATHFSIPVNVTVGGAGGTATRTSTRNGAACIASVGDLVLAGFTNLTIKVRDSADGVTFADLLTFAVVTGVGRAAEVKTDPGPIERYAAAWWDFTGAGGASSAELMVGIKRLEGVS